MKISILSDIHLGFSRGTEIEGDSYEALAEALERSGNSDLVLIAGDMFDSSNPPAEVLALSEEILLPSLLENGDVRILEGIGKDIRKLRLVNPNGKLIIAIHGTHERRAKGLLNPVQALERAGFLAYLHCNGIILEKRKGQQLEPESLTAKANGEKPSPACSHGAGESMTADAGLDKRSLGRVERVCVQGMSGVPDQYAERVLQEWDPRPREGCHNILLIHQNLKGFMHEKVPNQLGPERLNRGFDLYVCGHIHEAGESELGGSRLLMPGGMVTTQVREGGKELGFYIIDTQTGMAEFVKLESRRKIYLLEAGSGGEAEREIGKILEEKHERKPIIRVNIKGNFPVKGLREGFGDRAILSFRKGSGAVEEPVAVGLEEQRLSVRELGRKLLRENLEKQGLEPDLFESIFELLLERREGKALELLKEWRGEKEAERLTAKANGEKQSPSRSHGAGERIERKRKSKKEETEKWEGRGELGKFFG